jgi:hypothetical protein
MKQLELEGEIDGKKNLDRLETTSNEGEKWLCRSMERFLCSSNSAHNGLFIKIKLYMREFTVLPKVQDFELDMIENIIGKKFPLLIREYIKKYAGFSIAEKYFKDNNNLEWELSQFNRFNDLYGLTNEFLIGYNRKLIPFAYDPGGWHFCLCMDDSDFEAIYVNRWTDHLPNEQFVKIADSFEEFINKLKSEEEN